eukprot:CAMPEP_0202874022 /NCGR_PEP_ID=MMETSP1391-20130828/24545_1 /ASSEMBLY_ACC=CAM_ASM_000867 /TAXON_ID=1034604 /ORGANISM="Chlamydomonas leiostraca, Strain SAG 11-49" /LENGTH=70 /DNA_ID=CAMNT_0049555367 /DNA_START=140 /DNA_END=352 /DNA_ORIENTATION=-
MAPYTTTMTTVMCEKMRPGLRPGSSSAALPTAAVAAAPADAQRTVRWLVLGVAGAGQLQPGGLLIPSPCT